MVLATTATKPKVPPRRQERFARAYATAMPTKLEMCNIVRSSYLDRIAASRWTGNREDSCAGWSKLDSAQEQMGLAAATEPPARHSVPARSGSPWYRLVYKGGTRVALRMNICLKREQPVSFPSASLVHKAVLAPAKHWTQWQ